MRSPSQQSPANNFKFHDRSDSTKFSVARPMNFISVAGAKSEASTMASGPQMKLRDCTSKRGSSATETEGGASAKKEGFYRRRTSLPRPPCAVTARRDGRAAPRDNGDVIRSPAGFRDARVCAPKAGAAGTTAGVGARDRGRGRG